jgi:pimeloyl-ACP methyl ester carboxylesterase
MNRIGVSVLAVVVLFISANGFGEIVTIDNSYVNFTLDPSTGNMTYVTWKGGSNHELEDQPWNNNYSAGPFRLVNSWSSPGYREASSVVTNVQQGLNYYRATFSNAGHGTKTLDIRWSDSGLQVQASFDLTRSDLFIGGLWEPGGDNANDYMKVYPGTSSPYTQAVVYRGSYTTYFNGSTTALGVADYSHNEMLGYRSTARFFQHMGTGESMDGPIVYLPSGKSRVDFAITNTSNFDKFAEGKWSVPAYDIVIPHRDPSPTGPTVLPSMPTQGQLKIYHNGIFDTNLGSFSTGKPTVVLVHGWNSEGKASVSEDVDGFAYKACVGGKLGQRTDLNILVWDWMQQARTGADADGGVPDKNTWSEGQALKSALASAIPLASYNKPMQILGHSLGGGVATKAALNLLGTYTVDQVTVFDAPEGHGPIEVWGSCDPLALDCDIEYLTSRGVWVDNYASAFGKNYHHSLGATFATSANVDMKPGLPLNVARADWERNHAYPMAWYFGWDSGWSPEVTDGTLNSAGLPSKPVGAG